MKIFCNSSPQVVELSLFLFPRPILFFFSSGLTSWTIPLSAMSPSPLRFPAPPGLSKTPSASRSGRRTPAPWSWWRRRRKRRSRWRGAGTSYRGWPSELKWFAGMLFLFLFAFFLARTESVLVLPRGQGSDRVYSELRRRMAGKSIRVQLGESGEEVMRVILGAQVKKSRVSEIFLTRGVSFWGN